MAEPLRNFFNDNTIRSIALELREGFPQLDADAFVASARDATGETPLTERARRITTAMRTLLPQDYTAVVDGMLHALRDGVEWSEGSGMAAFRYLPHVFYVAEYGLEHFDASMRLQYVLTQRFTAEFSIRPFLEQYPERTLTVLHAWVDDPSRHVRRLVSEGTRPRLPWAPRLRVFERDPAPPLALLERLRDDPELYVRRSVANHLNDIGKDHPELLARVCADWMRDATPEREWVVRHALRSAIKRTEPGALAVLGFARTDAVQVTAGFEPNEPHIGGSVTIAVIATNTSQTTQRVAIDLRVFFVKASGRAGAKVFKGATLELAAGGQAHFARTLSLRQHSTRTHFPGEHRVELLVNGEAREAGAFVLKASPDADST